MFVTVAVAILMPNLYQGVDPVLLYKHVIWLPGSGPTLQDIEDDMRRQGAFTPKSFPLYLSRLTSDPPGDWSKDAKLSWTRVRPLCMRLVARSEGDRSAFVPIGIGYLTDHDYGGAYAAPAMLAEIVSTPLERRQVRDAVVKAIDVTNTKDPAVTVLQLKLLGKVGFKLDVKTLEDAIDAEAIRKHSGGSQAVSDALEGLKARLEEEEQEPPKKK